MSQNSAELTFIEDPRESDGQGNNETEPSWGASGSEFLRAADYAGDPGPDLSSAYGRENPRTISNAVAAQTEDMPNSQGVSDLFWVWGQFLDHDITLLLEQNQGTNFAPIPVSSGDPVFDPDGTGQAIIPFLRAVPSSEIGGVPSYPDTQTAFIDGSMIYGWNATMTAAMLDGTGRIKLNEFGNLPLGENDEILFPGDVRVNENAGLTAMHNLFAREHNRWVDVLEEEFPDATPEELYEQARARVEAEIQAITFNEFLPVLLGPDAIETYQGYDSSIDPGITLEFATAAYRFGHSLVSESLERLEENGHTSAEGDLPLAEAFENPAVLSEQGAVADIMRGLAANEAQELDTQVIETLRSVLFGAPGDGGIDLASVNITRGRDLGLPDYNSLREAFGLERVESFAEVSSDTAVQAKLAAVYDTVDEIDPWVGGLAEDPVDGGLVGELFAAVLVDQFTRLRDGDRLWSENGRFAKDELDALWDTTLGDIIVRNTEVEDIQEHVFLAEERTLYNLITGTNRKDDIAGTNKPDWVEALGGGDRIRGKDGDDKIFGGDGKDMLRGNRGNDTLMGEEGEDTLLGSGQHDTLYGGLHGDRLWGHSGNDKLMGNGGNDEMLGASGNDLMNGGMMNDRLDGGSGDDTLMGGEGQDLLIGGRGNDYLAGGADRDVFEFRERDGRDKIVDLEAHDVVDLRAFDFRGFGDLDFHDRKGDTVLDLGKGDEIVFVGLSEEDLSPTQFLL